jgi:hypothetical protein
MGPVADKFRNFTISARIFLNFSFFATISSGVYPQAAAAISFPFLPTLLYILIQ